MSSYLTFYLVPKVHPEEKLSLLSYSRSCEIYSYFIENLCIPFMGNSETYKELTVSDIDMVLHDIDKDIKTAETRLQEYRNYANGNIDVIQEILSQQEYLDDLKSTRNDIFVIQTIAVELDYSSFSKLLCNIG